MASPSDSPLTRSARRHARRLEVVFAFTFVTFVLLTQLSVPVIEWLTDWLGTNLSVSLVLVPIFAAISIFISWSAIWVVLGSGRWLRRVLFSFAVFHTAVGISVAIAFVAEYLRDEFLSGFWLREMFGMFAAISYGFAICLACFMFFVWLMKLCRYRLLYFHSPEDYPRSRETACEIPIDARPETAVLSGRVYLADMFALTTLFALYLGGWYPIVHVALEDDRMFGAGFFFAIVVYGLLINGAIGLFVALFPLLMGMLDHRGGVFQIVINAIVLVIGCSGAAVLVIYNDFEPEVIVFGVTSVTALILYQMSLYLVLKRPSRIFRFRLVRPGR